MKDTVRDETQYEAIYTKYPLLFEKQGDKWNIEIGPMQGWLPLIDKLCKEISNLLCELPEDYRTQFSLDQIKEKTGTLRFYVGWEDNDARHFNGTIRDIANQIDAHVHLAEAQSAFICEVCSYQPSKLRNNKGHYKTLCTEHYEDWLK